MTFETITDLAAAIDNKIGMDFILKFQHTRKELKDAYRTAGRQVFGNCHDDDNWAINKGGGTEIQYHISFHDHKIFYGIGFSAQYVQFNNQMYPQDYIRPFTQAFAAHRAEVNQLLPDYAVVKGTEQQLKNPAYGNFILFGKTVPYTEPRPEVCEVADSDMTTMIADLKRQLAVYKLVFKAKNQLSHAMVQITTYTELLKIKPQLILQGAPGTGKTYTAQEIAYQKIFGKPMSADKATRTTELKELSNSEQYAFVQFHPAYSYEDFIRGIAAKPNGTAISYQAENRSFAKFADLACQNLEDSRKGASEYADREQIKAQLIKFRQDLEEKLATTGNIKLTDAAYIDRLNDDTIRYRGASWQIDGGVPDKDLIEMQYKKVNTPDDVRGLATLTLSAKSNFTYWLKMLELFRTFVTGLGESSPAKPLEQVSQKPFVFIIDEINRANLPAVLGELIFALEYRDTPVKSLYELPTGSDTITIPSNLLIIGTMNTADRSVGHIDYAIRRRFSFADIGTNEEVIIYPKAKRLFSVIKSLFLDEDNHKSEYLNGEFEAIDVMPGHSYYLTNDDAVLRLKLEFDLLPILKEYVRDGILNEIPDAKIKEMHDAIN